MTTRSFRSAHGAARLDQEIASCVPGVSRRRARALIEQGAVTIDGVRVRTCGRGVRPGALVELTLDTSALPAVDTSAPLPTLTSAATGSLPLERAGTIIAELDGVIVVDKRAGVATEPTRTSARSLTTSLAAARGHTVAAVNRLDVDTSGLVVVATDAGAADRWGRPFRDAAQDPDGSAPPVERAYIGLVDGIMGHVGAERTIDLWLLAPDERGRARVGGPRTPRAKRAITDVQVVAHGTDASVVVLRPRTGRTHQLRVHLADIGHPLIGDRRYGTPRDPGSPLGLHAAALAVLVAGVRHRFNAPLPSPLVDAATARGLSVVLSSISLEQLLP